MIQPIQAIVFDNNGTLSRTTRYSEEEKARLVQPLQQLIGSTTPPLAFVAQLTARSQAYRQWTLETLINVDEVNLWTTWLLPEYPSSQIAPLAIQLNRLWRQTIGVRSPMPSTRETLLSLFRRGYRLGIVSNTNSREDVPEMLKGLGLAGCFETIILSGLFGKRKPDPSMLTAAAAEMHLPPSACAYVGNRAEWDVVAARRAGYAKTILLRDSTAPQVLDDPELVPDHYIDHLHELVELLPALNGSRAPESRWDVSLSTMWGMKNFACLEDFLTAAGRYGYGKIELNHQISPAMLEGIDLNRFNIRSIHEPCPTELSTDELKKRDWLISSPHDENRLQGVACVKRSIDLAHQLKVPVIVVHGGQVITPQNEEYELRALYAAGQKGTVEYKALKARMISRREKVIQPHLDAVKKSLRELLVYAAPLGVRLGLENRYHWTDIPTQDEMEQLLALGSPDQLGFVFDSGHATALDRLGFYTFEGWLSRFSYRIVGCHLHDVIGLEDHYAPGMGIVDFDMIEQYLPLDAFRTLEMRTSNTAQQVKAGVRFLADKGIIKPVNS